MTETVTIEKQVWKSTLHRSMVLQAENETLKELLKEYKDITAIALLYTKDDKEFEKAKNIRERIDEVLNA